MKIQSWIKQARILLAKKFDCPAGFAGGLPIYAQGKEDLILLRLFGKDHKGYYVDVGANNGIFISNTFALYRAGWRGMCVEPNPEAFAKLKSNRSQDVCLNVAVGAEPGVLQLNWQEGITEGSFIDNAASAGGPKSTVEVRTLGSLLKAHDVPADFDLLSIDVEGYEMNVLKGLAWESFRPHIIILEYNAGGTVNNEAVEFVLEKNYRPIYINRWNMIFSSRWAEDALRVHRRQTWFQLDPGGL